MSYQFESTVYSLGANGLEKVVAPDLPRGTVIRYTATVLAQMPDLVLTGESGPFGAKAITQPSDHRAALQSIDVSGSDLKRGWCHVVEGEAWTDEQVTALEQQLRTETDARMKALREKEAEEKRLRQIGEAYWNEHRPAWAKACILAEHERDDSDYISDYVATKSTGDFLLLAFSKHKRNLFPEMRKACRGCGVPDVEALEHSSPDAEHRDNHSMGRGLYLKAGLRYASGWYVYKTYGNLSWDKLIALGRAVEAGDPGRIWKAGTTDASSQADGEAAEALPSGDLAVTIEEYSEKALVVRGDTKPLAPHLREVGGRFNPRLKGGAGWIFSKRREERLRQKLAGLVSS